MWAALLASGIDPLVAGLAIGLAAPAYSPARSDSRRRPGCSGVPGAADPGARADGRAGLTATLSPNARLQRFYLPWTSYVVVPLFALANAGSCCAA